MPKLMKGNVWSERKHKMTYPCVAEIKYDEIRVNIQCVRTSQSVYVQFLSYADNPLHNLGMYTNRLVSFFGQYPHINQLDCGFEVNGNFNDSMSWVRSSRGVPEDLRHADHKFFLFDLPDEVNSAYATRRHRRDHIAYALANVFALPFYPPESTICGCEADVDVSYNKARTAKYEGLMVKSMEHTYHTKPARTDGWLKMKPEEDADGWITGINEAKSESGDRLGRAGSVDVHMEDGSVASPAGIPFALGYDMFKDPFKYIGEWCTFKYMQRDRAGGYRHPSFVRMREAKA